MMMLRSIFDSYFPHPQYNTIPLLLLLALLLLSLMKNPLLVLLLLHYYGKDSKISLLLMSQVYPSKAYTTSQSDFILLYVYMYMMIIHELVFNELKVD